MPIRPEKLKFLALSVVDQAAHECIAGPIKPSIGLRLALNFLQSVAQGEKACFGEFVQAIQTEVPGIGSETERRFIRGTRAQTCLKAMIRSVGYPQTPEAASKLGDTWRGH